MQKIINIENGVCRMPKWRMAEPVDFTALDGEHIAIVGPNGGGKSMLADIIVGRHPLLGNDPEYDFAPSTRPMVSDNIRYITFRDTYGGDSDRTYFLQQRWNSQEIGDDNSIVLLSSGELRKLKLRTALSANPRVLIIDNPFIGLDAETRDQLRILLGTLAAERKLQIILILSRTDEIPEFITHVVEVRDMKVGRKMTRTEFMEQRQPVPPHVLAGEKERQILALPYSDGDYAADEVIRLNNVSIVYGERTILESLDWTVSNGEHWALSGPNGAGKSTLLSLVCADNPQSYACDISLFGRQRGTGESIWDIKKHIGYVSPEMHRAYHRDIQAMNVVASGLKDSVGLYVKPTEGDMEKCRFWMDMFGLEGKEDRSLLSLSSGEQRLVLLARAFVKDPELLIIDEPLHGLDDWNRQMVKDIIDVFCRRRNKTLIMVSHYREEFPSCIDHELHLSLKKS